MRAFVGVVAAGALLGAALEGGVAAAVPAAATVARAAVAQTRLSLDPPSPGRIYEDNVTQLTGRLSKARAGKLIVIRKRESDHWHRVGTTRTDASGSFRFDYVPADPGTETLQAAHPVGHGPVTSQSRTLTVLDRRVFLVTQPSYDTFTPITLTGTVRPAQPHRRVFIQHWAQGRWVPGANAYTDASGHYSITMRNNMPGRWAVRAWWGGSDPSGGTLEVSMTHRYDVNAVLHPVVTHVTREQLGGSYHAGCPVGPALLRNVGVTFKTFGPFVDRGTIVVRDSVVRRVITTLRQGLDSRYPIRRMFPTARYGGNDVAAMRHDDTSGFNCRHVTGDPTRLSPHSYGIAVDVDTVENPYQDDHGTWWPKDFGQRFRNRSHPRPGMLFADSVVTRGLLSRGFQWGGVWSHPDYQHFDTFGNQPKRPAPPTAGPLSARSLPAPKTFGPDWRRDAEAAGGAAASGEAGRVGNGTFVSARPGAQAARGVLPLGCTAAPPAPGTLPAARFALEGSYRSSTGAVARAVARAVVLRFAGPRRAAAFFTGLRASLLSCTSADSPSGLRVEPARWTGTTFSGVRVYGAREAWLENDVRSGATVTVTLAQRAPRFVTVRARAQR